MTKKFSLMQLFSIVDGRLARTIDDVYDILNHVTDMGEDLMTHHLPVAYSYLKEKNPKWYQELKEKIGFLEKETFESAIHWVEAHNDKYDIPQLKDEFDTSDFGGYMVGNSLLLKKLN